MARKLHRIILLQFGLVTCKIHFGKTRKVIICIFLDLVDVSMTPKTNYLLIWKRQDTQNDSRNSQIIFGKYRKAQLKLDRMFGEGQREKGKFVAQKRKRGYSASCKGKKGKWWQRLLWSNSTRHSDRAHERTHAWHDTKRFAVWIHPPTSEKNGYI